MDTSTRDDERADSRMPVVLAAIDETKTGAAALRRARRWAEAIGAGLAVVHVVAPADLRGHQPHRTSLADRARRLEAWALEALGDAPACPMHFSVSAGLFVPVVSSAAARLDAWMTVVSAERTNVGRARTLRENLRLVSTSRRPVLIAGRRSGGGRVVVATDLRSPELPVVGVAERLAERIGASITAVHIRQPGCDADEPLHLDAATMARLPDNFVVVRGRRASAGILDISDRKDADLIVAGRRVCAHDALMRRGSTLRGIAAITERSILAVPLPPLGRQAA